MANTGMAVIIDKGEANDIHPKDKQAVGHRLALIAVPRRTESKYLIQVLCTTPMR